MNNKCKHELKTWPEYFQEIKARRKTFEVRKNDRDFKLGDTLLLKEWKPKGHSSVSPNKLTGEYTGDELSVEVTYILQVKPEDAATFGISSNTVVMAIKPTPPTNEMLEERTKSYSEDSPTVAEFIKNLPMAEESFSIDEELKNMFKPLVASYDHKSQEEIEDDSKKCAAIAQQHTNSKLEELEKWVEENKTTFIDGYETVPVKILKEKITSKKNNHER